MFKTVTSKAAAVMLTLFFGIAGALQAQQAITISGGAVATGAGSLSFSCGEVAVKTSIAPAVTVINITESFSEGVQQPFTDRDGERYDGIESLTVNVAVYPNPTTNNVVFECDQLTNQLTYTLYNSNGQTLQEGTYKGGQQLIDMQKYVAGNYVLKIASTDSKQMNVYKIIKAK